MSAFSRRRAIARKLSPYLLQQVESESLSLAELDEMSSECRASPRFLGYYSHAGLEQALQAYGLYAELALLGFHQIVLVLNTEDPYEQRMALYEREISPDTLLYEMVVRRQALNFNQHMVPEMHFRDLCGRCFDFLDVEWLCLQNPQAQFSEARPRLPGQEHPGLGIGPLVMDLVQLAAERLNLAGVITIPAYFHNAVMYHPRFHYLELDC